MCCLHDLQLLLILLFLSGGCHGNLHLSPAVDNAERVQSESYIVTCQGSNAVGTAWRGPGKKAIPARIGRIHTEERETGAVSLVFESIQRTDKGTYTCTATIDNQPTTLSFNLTVVRPIKFISGLAEQNLTDHQSGLIRCEASGEPKPTIVWSVNGKTVSEGGKYAVRSNGLYIMNVSKEDEGTYICRALQVTAQTSTVHDQIITVSVHYKPRWKGRQLEWYGYVGGVANLSCQVDAKPPADFTWEKVEETLESPRIFAEPNRSVLQVNVTDNRVFGKYKCTAWNSVGNISREGDLKEGRKPGPPAKVLLEEGTAGDEIKLRVSWPNEESDPLGVRVEFMEHTGDGTLAWSHPQFQDLYLEDGPLILQNLKSHTNYVLRVATLGLAGVSDFAEEMKYVTSIGTSLNSPTYYQLLACLLIAFKAFLMNLRM